MLRKVSHDIIVRNGDSAGVGMLLSCDHPEQRRLAMSVPSYEPDAFSRIDSKTDLVEYDLPAVSLG